MRYFHVAGDQYQAGDDLLCRDALIEAGLNIAWKWEDAPEGFDGDAVCLFETEAEAREHLAEFGGTLLAVDVPDEMLGDAATDRQYWRDQTDGIAAGMTRVDEGFAAIRGGIPADWLSEVE